MDKKKYNRLIKIGFTPYEIKCIMDSLKKEKENNDGK
jgi:hypothetical protein